MAKKFVVYPEGSPQRQLQDVLNATFDPNERFFERVAERLNLQPQSISGTFYGFMAASRSLPDAHRKQYVELLGVSDELLDEIAAMRTVEAPERRDRLRELAGEVADLVTALDVAKRANQEIARRVAELEQWRDSLPAARRGTGSNRPARSGG